MVRLKQTQKPLKPCCAVENHRSIHSLPQLQFSSFLMKKVQTLYAGPCVFIIYSIGEYNSQSAELHKFELKHYVNNAYIVVQFRIGTGRDRRTRVRLEYYLKTP
jgi:5-carboxymethyl-2-hydroxymuconate isomerase